jgi:hypothetical protein
MHPDKLDVYSVTNWSDEIKEGEKNGACSTHARYHKFIHSFGLKNLKETNHSEDLDVGGKAILK